MKNNSQKLWQWPRSLGPLLLSLYAHSTWQVRGAGGSKSVLCYTKMLFNVCDRFQILKPKSKAREHMSFCGQGGICPWYALTSKTSSMPRFKGSINAAINADDSYTTVLHVKFRCFVSNHVWKSNKYKIAHGRFLWKCHIVLTALYLSVATRVAGSGLDAWLKS